MLLCRLNSSENLLTVGQEPSSQQVSQIAPAPQVPGRWLLGLWNHNSVSVTDTMYAKTHLIHTGRPTVLHIMLGLRITVSTHHLLNVLGVICCPIPLW